MVFIGLDIGGNRVRVRFFGGYVVAVCWMVWIYMLYLKGDRLQTGGLGF